MERKGTQWARELRSNYLYTRDRSIPHPFNSTVPNVWRRHGLGHIDIFYPYTYASGFRKVIGLLT